MIRRMVKDAFDLITEVNLLVPFKKIRKREKVCSLVKSKSSQHFMKTILKTGLMKLWTKITGITMSKRANMSMI